MGADCFGEALGWGVGKRGGGGRLLRIGGGCRRLCRSGNGSGRLFGSGRVWVIGSEGEGGLEGSLLGKSLLEHRDLRHLSFSLRRNGLSEATFCN